VSLRRWRTFESTFRDARGAIAASVGLSIARSALLLPVALVVHEVFDRYVPRGDTAAIMWSGALVLGLYLGSAVLAALAVHVVLRTTRRALIRLRSSLLERILSLPRAWFDRTNLGRLHSTVVQDSVRVDMMVNALVGLIMPSATVALGLCVVLAILNPLLFAILGLVLPLLLVFGRLLGRRVREHSRRVQLSFDVFSEGTNRTLRSITLAKVQGAEREELRARRDEHQRLGDDSLRLAWVRGCYQVVQGAVAASAGAVVLVFGGIATAKGTMSLGELIAFYAVLALLLREIHSVLLGMPHVLTGYEALSRLDDLLSVDHQEPYLGGRPVAGLGGIALEQVTFGYGEEPLLSAVDIRVEPGERVAIFGPNGAGKSTIASLILGLYRPGSGRVVADGVPYDQLDMRSLRRHIGVVLQEPVIFPGTIAENIAYGNSDCSPEELVEAARRSTAHEFIQELPDGYATSTGDDGTLLSAGQRQRISIARALAGRPSLLVLDEPTTHLDDTSIKRLMESLRGFPGAPALVMISHDLQVAESADTVHHLRDGRIVRTDRRAPRTELAAV
jgi:ABC-type multidrug transport system fused ATPase/permease subunit